jgi:hypothetical protein
MQIATIGSLVTLTCGFLVGCGGDATPPPATPASTSAGSTPTGAPAGATALAAPTVPDAIKTPAGQTPLLKADAKGFQVYVCKAKADNASAFEWSLKAPDAELLDEHGQKMGKHYGGPTWEANDGSKVVAQKKAQADAPDAAKAIPWLLLEVKSSEGKGAMAGVQSIQRVATSGGKAPADGCDSGHSGAETRVPYTATYYFNGIK